MLQERLNLRPVAGGRLEHLTPGFRGGSSQRKPRAEAPIGPALVGAEEEGPPADDRTADVPPSWFSTRNGRIAAARGLVEIAARVQAVVVVKPEQTPSKLLVPLLVTTFITEPAARPNSAAN